MNDTNNIHHAEFFNKNQKQHPIYDLLKIKPEQMNGFSPDTVSNMSYFFVFLVSFLTSFGFLTLIEVACVYFGLPLFVYTSLFVLSVAAFLFFIEKFTFSFCAPVAGKLMTAYAWLHNGIKNLFKKKNTVIQEAVTSMMKNATNTVMSGVNGAGTQPA